MNIVFNGVIDPTTTFRAVRGHPVSFDAGRGDILILTRSSDVAVNLYRGLRIVCRGCEIIHAACVERALKCGRERHLSVVFLGCDLPVTVFQQLQRDTTGKSVRIIGVREDGGTMQAMRLMSHRLISAYVGVPPTLASLQALVCQSSSSSSMASVVAKTVSF